MEFEVYVYNTNKRPFNIKDLTRIVSVLADDYNIKGNIQARIVDENTIYCYIYSENPYNVSDIKNMLKKYKTEVRKINKNNHNREEEL